MKSRSNDTITRPLLSIVIPAYNVESYLEKCIMSLVFDKKLNKQLEIIIVNDGSSDRTKEISEEFTTKYSNVKLISKINGGHGSTINAGLKAAKGKYFKLLDGDDWLDAKALSILLSKLSNSNTDIILSDYKEFYSSSKTTKSIRNYSHLTPDRVYDIDGEQLFTHKGPLLATTTFKTQLYKDKPFTIDEHCFYVDMEYNFFIYQRAATLEYTPLDLYQYRLEREGQSMQLSSMKKNYLNHEKVLLRISEELQQSTSFSNEKRSYLLKSLVAPMARSHYQILTEYIGSPKLFREFDKKLSRYSEVYHLPLVSGKIIVIHRVTRGVTVVFDILLRKLGGVVNSLEKK